MSRLEAFRQRLAERELPAALLRDRHNVTYLSGFSGSTAALLVTAGDACLVTDTRYTIQARQECPDLRIAITSPGQPYHERIAEEARSLDIRRLAVEEETLSLKAFRELGEALPGVELVPATDLVAPLRHLQDADEIERTRRACAIADTAFEEFLSHVRPGTTERDLAAELEYLLKRHGAEREAFETVVASGERSALPHARASSKPIEQGDLVVLDFGARWRGYHSDVTRTVVVGPATEEQRRAYGTVLATEEVAIAAIAPGIEARCVDAAARQQIEAAGFPPYGHGLGHSLGLTVHDGLNMNNRAEFRFAPGMVLTVEPGIYVEGWGGIRIEDDVLVTKRGCEVLTRARKGLLELG